MDWALGPAEVTQSFDYLSNSQGVKVNSSSNLTVKSITIEGWINPTDVSNFRPIVEYGADTGPDPVEFAYGWNDPGATTPGALYALFRDAGGGLLKINSAGGLLPANRWSHVAMTFNYATQVGNLYLNGTNVASAAYPGTLTPQTALPVHLGYRPSGSSEGGFNGTSHLGGFDEFSIYNRALTPCEITAIYNAGSAGKQSLLSTTNNATPASASPYADFDQDGIPISGKSRSTSSPPISALFLIVMAMGIRILRNI